MRAILIAACAVLGAFAAAARPPDLADPSTWGEVEPLPVETPDPADAFAQAAARAAERAKAPVVTQRMARVRGEMLAAIETDAQGNKTAKIVYEDGTVEIRPLKVMHTARVLPPKPPPEPHAPIDGTHAAAAAAGAAAALAAAQLKKKGTAK